MRKIAAALLALAVLAGCDWGNHLETGTIVGKEYDDPDTYVSNYCASFDYKTGACNLWLPMLVTNPARYLLKIHGEWNGKFRTETWNVDPATYDRARVGWLWDHGSVVKP